MFRPIYIYIFILSAWRWDKTTRIRALGKALKLPELIIYFHLTSGFLGRHQEKNVNMIFLNCWLDCIKV